MASKQVNGNVKNAKHKLLKFVRGKYILNETLILNLGDVYCYDHNRLSLKLVQPASTYLAHK